MPDLDEDHVLEATWTAFTCALLGEEGRAGESVTSTFLAAIEEIMMMGLAGIHLALCGWCGLTMHKLAQISGLGDETENFRVDGDGYWHLQVQDAETGESASIDEIGRPAERDALRVAVCFANRDHDTIAAIVEATWNAGPEAAVDLLLAAVRLAAKTTKATPEAAETGDDG
jgi:hypothetical protein